MIVLHSYIFGQFGLPCVLKKSGLANVRVKKLTLFLCGVPYCNILDVFLPTVEVMGFRFLWSSTVAVVRPFTLSI